MSELEKLVRAGEFCGSRLQGAEWCVKGDQIERRFASVVWTLVPPAYAEGKDGVADVARRLYSTLLARWSITRWRRQKFRHWGDQWVSRGVRSTWRRCSVAWKRNARHPEVD